MSERIADLTIGGFGEALSSKAPVPGGGGASSVAAAVGCSLGRMVASLTVGKKRYADVEERVQEIAERLDALRDELLALADDDAEAFEPLSRAYGLPKATDAERARKAEVMEAALRRACEPPMAILERIVEAAALVGELARIGSRIAVSDAGAGAALLAASARAVSLNVYINARSMADRGYAEDLVARADSLVARAAELGDAAYEQVRGEIR